MFTASPPGKEGRPVGVVEPSLTVRVEDLLGEWVQIRHEDGLAWVQWRDQASAFQVLVPASKAGSKKAWGSIETWSRPTLFCVSDALPVTAELKVCASVGDPR